jgi:hypothetical protein
MMRTTITAIGLVEIDGAGKYAYRIVALAEICDDERLADQISGEGEERHGREKPEPSGASGPMFTRPDVGSVGWLR